MNILLLGSGGREHALAWKLAQSPQCTALYAAPGNPGIAEEAECVALDAGDHGAVLQFCEDRAIGLVVIGPEAPLVDGLADSLRAANIPAFGPSKQAAQLEGSKAFTKHFLARHGIPTAAYGNFTDADAAKAYIREHGAPIVVKADGLAAGKGVILAQTVEEAEAAVEDMLAGNAFGEAGHRVVVEEFLVGEEASFICIVDGRTALPMASSQDHKAVGEGDTGPNTGGMGAYSPAPVVTAEVHERVMGEVIVPTVRGMAREGNAFTGFLYAGLMIGPDGAVKVLEYNARLGDPETQPILTRLQSDLITLLEAALDGRLDQTHVRWNPNPALGVVMAAGGYPGVYGKGNVITGIAAAEAAGCKVFHAGTGLKDGRVVTTGGRVLCVVAEGETVKQAQVQAYAGVDCIGWDGVYARRDIGYRAVAREKDARP